MAAQSIWFARRVCGLRNDSEIQVCSPRDCNFRRAYPVHLGFQTDGRFDLDYAPGLIAWGTIIVLRGENWSHRDAIGLLLLTVGNAFFYSWFCFFALSRKRDGQNGSAARSAR